MVQGLSTKNDCVSWTMTIFGMGSATTHVNTTQKLSGANCLQTFDDVIAESVTAEIFYNLNSIAF